MSTAHSRTARLCLALLLSTTAGWTAASFLASPAAVAQTTQEGSQIIAASDKQALDEHQGERVTVEGVVSKAAWSSTGKVMQIDFADTQQSGFMAVVFERSRKSFDEGFGGNFADAIEGARIRVRGELGRYGGYVEEYKGRPQMILNGVDQVTIVEIPEQNEDNPTTQPIQPAP